MHSFETTEPQVEDTGVQSEMQDHRVETSFRSSYTSTRVCSFARGMCFAGCVFGFEEWLHNTLESCVLTWNEAFSAL